MNTYKKKNCFWNTKAEMFTTLVFVFVFGSFTGYVVEVLYAFLLEGRFINKQGMIYGPFNQIYGFGGIVFAILFNKVHTKKTILIFLISAIVGGAFEYLCSFIQEVIFKSESWHYDNLPLNINGRTNALHCIMWGILGASFFCWIMPLIISLVAMISDNWRLPFAWILFVFMILNMGISACAVYRQSIRIQNVSPQNAFEEFLDEHYSDSRLKKVYTNMTFLSLINDNK